METLHKIGLHALMVVKLIENSYGPVLQIGARSRFALRQCIAGSHGRSHLTENLAVLILQTLDSTYGSGELPGQFIQHAHLLLFLKMEKELVVEGLEPLGQGRRPALQLPIPHVGLAFVQKAAESLDHIPQLAVFFHYFFERASFRGHGDTRVHSAHDTDKGAVRLQIVSRSRHGGLFIRDGEVPVRAPVTAQVGRGASDCRDNGAFWERAENAS